MDAKSTKQALLSSEALVVWICVCHALIAQFCGFCAICYESISSIPVKFRGFQPTQQAPLSSNTSFCRDLCVTAIVSDGVAKSIRQGTLYICLGIYHWLCGGFVTASFRPRE